MFSDAQTEKETAVVMAKAVETKEAEEAEEQTAVDVDIAVETEVHIL